MLIPSISFSSFVPAAKALVKNELLANLTSFLPSVPPCLHPVFESLTEIMNTARRHAIKNVSSSDHKDDGHLQASVYNPDFLRRQARWIRDDLDPQVARDGPDALHSDDILTLDEFLRRLLTSSVRLEDIRFSRLHLAILGICGLATRWPKKLIERADTLRGVWEVEHGPLERLLPPLYEPGGRLHGLCKPEDLSKEKVIIKWLKTPGLKPSPLHSRKVGDLGFQPGEYVLLLSLSLTNSC